MSSSPITVLRQYANKIEAETIRMRLAAAGIPAWVTGEDAGTALGLGGAVTNRMVRVEVAESDYERADALLLQDERRLMEAGPWICGRCFEQNEAAFEVCWSCNKPRSDDDKRGRVHETRATEPSAEFGQTPIVQPANPVAFDPNPYRPVLLAEENVSRPVSRVVQPPTESMAESVTRCFRAAIVGVMVFPPLVSLYAVFLLVQVSGEAYCHRHLRRRLIIAWCINLVNIPAWSIFWLQTS